jgi:hypothetical protein
MSFESNWGKRGKIDVEANLEYEFKYCENTYRQAA